MNRIDASGEDSIDLLDGDKDDDEHTDHGGGNGKPVGGSGSGDPGNLSGGSGTQGSSGYSAPPGGGGISNKIQIGNTTVEFGHGGRHLDGTGFTTSQVESAIAKDVVGANIPIKKYYPGSIQIGTTTFVYSGFRLSENRINIGTYHIKY